MVGVPGRSKACHTCRKRRIACSLDTPQCKQCLKSNRVCGGYQRERIWVPNNQIKLESLQASMPQEPMSSKSNPKDGRLREIDINAEMLASDKLSPPRFYALAIESLPRLTQTVKSSYPFHQQILSEFLYNYIPDMDRISWNRTGASSQVDQSWLMQIPGLVDVTTCLEVSILALSAAKLGRLDDNMALVRESRKLYGQSIRELQKALYDPALMYRDETLAACLALTMYEVTECPSENWKGWVTHSDGCLRLIELRGPEAHASRLGHQLFVSCRYNSMIRALPTNRQNFLSKSEWMTLPWNGKTKTISDKLEDVLVSGMAILEAAAKLGQLKGTRYLLLALKVVESCWKVDTELREIYKELEDSVQGPLFWPELSTQDNPADDSELGKVFPVAYHYPNLRVSHLCTLYWTICIILWGGLFHLYQDIATKRLEEDEASIGQDGCTCTTLVHICGQHAKHFDISELPPLKDRDVLSAIRNICQSFEFCIRPENKGIGVASIIFPLQVAAATLKEYPGCERELSWARASVEMLNDKGFRILKFAAA